MHRRRRILSNLFELESRFTPANFQVTNILNSGGGSLRQAILDANAVAGPDTIDFDPVVFSAVQTITLASPISITGEVVITGPVNGPNSNLLTVSGGGAVGVFSTTAGAAGTLITIDKVNISGGSVGTGAGGGLTVGDENVTFSNGSITGCTASEGGGIRLTGAGTLTITGATLSNNVSNFATVATANGGGAIRATTNSVLTISNTTLSANTATNGGGAIYTSGSTIGLTNVTFLNNQSLSTTTATTTYGGGAVWANASSKLTMTGGKFEANTSAHDAGALYVQSSTANITGTTFLNNRSLVTNTAITSTYGGGAIRLSGTTPLTLDGCTFQGNTANNCGGAIYNGGTVNITNTLFTANKAVNSGGTLTGRGGAIYSLNAATTVGITNSRLTGNSAGTLGGAFYNGPNAGSAVTITGSQLDANTASGTGGVMYLFNGGLTVSNSKLHANSTAGNGGAVFANAGATFSLTNNTFSNNSATGSGGGLFINGAVTSLTLTGSTLTANTAGGNSGGLFTNGAVATLLISNSTFNGNIGSAGGAVHLGAQGAASSTTVRNSTIVGNTSTSGSTVAGAAAGGLAMNSAAPLTLASTIISGNTHTGSAGFLDLSLNAGVTFTADTGFNAIGSNAGHTPFLTTSSTPTAGTNLDYGTNLLLGPLADNGGTLQGPTGLTANGKTIELLAGSPAINTGSNITPLLSTDARGGTFVRDVGLTDIGSFERVPGAPSATADPFLTVGEANFASQDPYVFSIKYNGDFTIEVAKLGDTDVRVVNTLAGYDQAATFVGVTPGTDNVSLVATYKVTAPAGGWTSAKNGLYSVNVQANEVFLTGTSTSVPATTVGAFIVSRDYIVTSAADTGAGTLRQAILDSNAAGGPNTIRFDTAFPASSYTVVGQMPVTDSLAIVGPGVAKLALNGGGVNRIFNINNASAQLDVSISGMKLFNASTSATGGAIFFGDERLTLTDMWLTGNKAASGGAVGNNSAVTFPAALTLNRTALTGNTATSRGGAVMFYSGSASVMDLRNSTLSGNSSGTFGGAFYGFNWNSATHKLLVTNSTVTANTSNTTSGGGGGIRVSGGVNAVITLKSSIVSGNTGPAGSPDFLNGTVNSEFSAIGSTTGTTIGTSTSDLAVGATLNLLPLADNGGQSPTHAPDTGSLLINAGSNPNADTTDQRGPGFSRSNAQTDIGSFEVQSSVPALSNFTVNNGATFRSRLVSIELNFAGLVTPASFPGLGDIKLVRTGLPTVVLPVGAAVGDVVQSGPAVADNHITLTQNGPNGLILTFDNAGSFTSAGPAILGVESGSLTDGYWQLYIGGTAVSTPGDTALRRLFGDSGTTALGTVNSVDLTAFGNDFNTNLPAFDFDNNGVVNTVDLTAFGNRFGSVL